VFAVTAHVSAAATVAQSTGAVFTAVSDETLQSLIYVGGSVVTALIAAVSTYLVARMTANQRRERRSPEPPEIEPPEKTKKTER
jgi:hypothetical protein